MLTNFNRNLELVDGLETDYLKLLYYDLPRLSSDYRSYEYSRLCTLLEGSKRVTLNNDTHFTYTPGQFILLPPYSSVHMDIDTPTKALVFELNDDLLKKVNEKISLDIDADYDSLSRDRFFRGDMDGDLGLCLNKTMGIFSLPDKNKKFLLDLCAQELVYYLIKIKGIQQILHYEPSNPVCRSMKYIQENIMKPLNIGQLAYDLNMSETNFYNSFKKVVGTTPKEYITNLKMIKARELLKDRNVTEVAFDLGYENISHFIALFKNKYGITPKQYQSIGETPVNYQF